MLLWTLQEENEAHRENDPVYRAALRAQYTLDSNFVTSMKLSHSQHVAAYFWYKHVTARDWQDKAAWYSMFDRGLAFDRV